MTSQQRARSTTTFRRNGFALTEHLEENAAHAALVRCENYQERFLDKRPHPPDYGYPLDALHWWSRVWEYPYALTNLLESPHLSSPIVDFGSGLTFFPFLVAEVTGHNVICVDTNGSLLAGVQKADKELGTNKVSFVQNSGVNIPLEDGSVSCVCSVSVLEHIPDPKRVVAEWHRILRTDGRIVITFDVSVAPNGDGLDARNFHDVLHTLLRYFRPVYEVAEHHPAELLRSQQGRYRLRSAVPMFDRMKHRGKSMLRPLIGRSPRQVWWESDLACYGFVGDKR